MLCYTTYDASCVSQWSVLIPANALTTTTSRRVCKFDLRLFAMDNSASKNKSSCPRKGLLGRLAPRATVWIMPSELVHQETMRLVSLSLRLRRRIPRVLAFTGDIKRPHQFL